MSRCFAPVAGLIVILASSGVVFADMIPIVNSSFEDPAYSAGDFGSANGWISTAVAGASHLTAASVNSVPDGLQEGFAGDTLQVGSLFQDLGVLVIPGATYTLDLYVGSRKEGIPANYLVELLAGNTTIGSASGTIATGTGDFFAVSVTAAGSGSGDLGIRLSQTSSGGQSLFDNLRLTATAVPEPSSALLISTGLVASLLYWRTGRRGR